MPTHRLCLPKKIPDYAPALDMKEEHFSSALWVFKEHVELAKQEEKKRICCASKECATSVAASSNLGCGILR
jgi:hypothetical protein